MRFLIFLLSFSSSAWAHQQVTICGTYQSTRPLTIKMYEPLKGYFNSYLIEHNEGTLKAASDSFHYVFQGTVPACFKLYLTYQDDGSFASVANILALPGDSIHVKIDLSKKEDEWILYGGNNAAGNQLFEKINYKPFNKFIPFHALLKQLPDNKAVFRQQVDEQVEKVKLDFRNLLQQGKLSKPYYTAMEATLSVNFYLEVITLLLTEGKLASVTEKPWRDAIATSLFSNYPPEGVKGLFNASLYAEVYEQFQVYMMQQYSSLHEYEKSNGKYRFKDSIIEINHILGYLPYIPDQEKREELWAFSLHNAFRFMPGYFKEDVLQQYDFIFPNSFFLPLLRQSFEKHHPGRDFTYSTSRKINYLDTTGGITDLKTAIYHYYKGKSVYVDMWASWCGPCITEFRHNNKIDSILLQNNVERLYVSLDNPGSAQAWRTAIDKYQLGGEHIIAGEGLRTQVRNWLSLKEQEPLSIPLYFLITGRGSVYLKAPYPSDHNFEKQLQELLLLEKQAP